MQDMIKTTRLTRRFLLSFIGATIATIICISDIFLFVSNSVNDKVYQRPEYPDERIVIIGIDDYAIAEFGTWPWSRDILAQAVAYLNSDPQNMPAVIGIDIVFDSDGDQQADANFAETLGEHGNVVVSTFATFGSELVTDVAGNFYINDYAILGFEESYDLLKDNVKQGHANAMLDDDGVLRHAIWEITLPDGRVIPAFSRVVAEEYCIYNDIPLPEKPPTDERGRWYIEQQALPNSYSDGISVADLVYENVSPQFFADKIVLIGPYTTGLHDEYKTPISSAENMYGVEYQANAISAILTGSGKAEPMGSQYILLFVLSFASFWILYDRRLIPSTIYSIIVSLIWFVFCVVMFEVGIVLHILYGLFTITLALFVSGIKNYIREHSEKRKVMLTFKRYVAPEIVSELMRSDQSGLELGGKTVDIAVLFADVRGFSALSSKIPARSVVEAINKILTATGGCIFENQGTLDKYIGDCTMAFWGAPLPQEDHVFKAVKTAIEIRDSINALSKELYDEFGYTLGCGIGLNCGPAVVGNIGSSTRMDYTVIGNTINAASRLEGLAEMGEVYVSKEVVEVLKGRVEFEYLGNNFSLKGISDSFDVYKVVSLIKS